MAESIKYCRNCGNKLDAGAKFCRKCGFQVATGQTGQARQAGPTGQAGQTGQTGQRPVNAPVNAPRNAGSAPVQPAQGRNQFEPGAASGNSGPRPARPAKGNSGSGKIIAIIAAVAAVILVIVLARHVIEQKRYDAYREESIENWEEYQKEQASDTTGGDTASGDTAAGGLLPVSSAKAQVTDGVAPVIGSIEQNGFSLQIEEDAFPGGTVVSVEPVSQDSISEFQNPEDYQLISAPVMIE